GPTAGSFGWLGGSVMFRAFWLLLRCLCFGAFLQRNENGTGNRRWKSPSSCCCSCSWQKPFLEDGSQSRPGIIRFHLFAVRSSSGRHFDSPRARPPPASLFFRPSRFGGRSTDLGRL